MVYVYHNLGTLFCWDGNTSPGTYQINMPDCLSFKYTLGSYCLIYISVKIKIARGIKVRTLLSPSSVLFVSSFSIFSLSFLKSPFFWLWWICNKIKLQRDHTVIDADAPCLGTFLNFKINFHCFKSKVPCKARSQQCYLKAWTRGWMATFQIGTPELCIINIRV